MSTSAIRRALVLIVVLVALTAAVYVGRDLIARRPAAAAQIDHGAYQAIVLNVGQTYYGKLSIADDETYLLSDVFYFLPAESGQSSRLVKRGGEFFGPREPMIILARQVLWFENVRDDSELANAIRQIKSGQGGPAPAPGPAATASPALTASPRPSASR
ncbi:MAG TPA: hypothetical protein VHG53_01550 [Candidatus Limnocylindria bacterium]|nr:hypothetical protein [Candidatus Limnocylindria bacterium]